MLRKDELKAVAKTTADPAEIARFDKLAVEWWKPDGAFKVVHAFNAARVAHLGKRLPDLMGRDASRAAPLAGLRILDVDAGAASSVSRYRGWVATSWRSTPPSATCGLPSATRAKPAPAFGIFTPCRRISSNRPDNSTS